MKTSKVVEEVRGRMKATPSKSIPKVNDNILDKTFFTDEAWFHLEDYVNS
ncbi:hypothetical protein BDFB_007782, partial [Asbolus verrucosus]